MSDELKSLGAVAMRALRLPDDEQVVQRRIDAIIGGIAGLAGGLLGLGGGFVLVPLQVIWAGRDQHRANGTSLAAILPIALVAGAAYYFGPGTPHTNLPVAFFLAAGGTIGALIGALAARRVSDRALKVIVAILLLGLGLYEVFDALRGAAAHVTAQALDWPQYALIASGGVAVGTASGLTGVGGGILIVPLLALGFGIGQRVAQGTSLIAILPTAAIGAITYYRSGDVDLRAVKWMAAAGMPAAIIGASLAFVLPERFLVGAFGAFMILAAVRTWPRRAASAETP
jgi:uncharacterized membrane protein YfcA